MAMATSRAKESNQHHLKSLTVCFKKYMDGKTSFETARNTSGYPILPTVSSNIFVERILLTVRISDWEVRDVLEGTKGYAILVHFLPHTIEIDHLIVPGSLCYSKYLSLTMGCHVVSEGHLGYS